MKIQWQKWGADATTEMMEMVITSWRIAGLDPQTMLDQFKQAEETRDDVLKQVEDAERAAKNQVEDDDENEIGDDDEDHDEEDEDEDFEFDHNDEIETEEDIYKFISAIESDLLDEKDIKGIACGSNFAFAHKLPLNSLSTFKPPYLLYRKMKREWGIANREDLLAMLQWLCMEGDKENYNLVIKKLKDIPPNKWEYNVENALYDNDTWLHQEGANKNVALKDINIFIKKVIESYTLLEDWGCFKTLPLPKIDSWDLGRAINLVRWGYDVNFLEKGEALYLIDQYYTQLKFIYKSWKSLSEGFILGYALYSKDGEELANLFNEHKIILSLKTSPWVLQEW